MFEDKRSLFRVALHYCDQLLSLGEDALIKAPDYLVRIGIQRLTIGNCKANEIFYITMAAQLASLNNLQVINN